LSNLAHQPNYSPPLKSCHQTTSYQHSVPQ
jgi:hypothetical protein